MRGLRVLRFFRISNRRNNQYLIRDVIAKYPADFVSIRKFFQTRHTVTFNRLFSTDVNTRRENLKERFKKTVKDYGATVVVFHIAISLASLGGFYLAVYSGLDVTVLMNYVEKKFGTKYASMASGASTFVVAYTIHKLLAPVRISITLIITPFIVRRLRKFGFLKPPKI